MCIVPGDEGTGERMKEHLGQKNPTAVTLVEFAVLVLCYALVLKTVEGRL